MLYIFVRLRRVGEYWTPSKQCEGHSCLPRPLLCFWRAEELQESNPQPFSPLSGATCIASYVIPRNGNGGARLTADAVGCRSLGVNLLYNYTCPVVYEPSGFAGSADANIFPLLSTTEGTETAGTFQAGPYEVAMAVKNAKLANKGANETPQIVQSTDVTSSRLEDMAIRKQLQAMQRSSSIPSNLILTQMPHGPEVSHSASQPGLATATPPKCGSALSVDWNSRRQRNVAAVKMAELIVQAWGLEKHNKSFMYLLDVDQLQKNKIKRLNPGRTVNCECGSDREEDAMVCASKS